jgi:hypothetical protein
VSSAVDSTTVGHATALQDEAIGVGEDGALDGREARGNRPGLDRLDLLLAEADGARGFAVLREHEAAAARVSGAQLPELAQLGRDLPLAAGSRRVRLRWRGIDSGRTPRCVVDRRADGADGADEKEESDE